MPHPLIKPDDLLKLSDFELDLLDGALRHILDHDLNLTEQDRSTVLLSLQSVRLIFILRTDALRVKGHG